MLGKNIRVLLGIIFLILIVLSGIYFYNKQNDSCSSLITKNVRILTNDEYFAKKNLDLNTEIYNCTKNTNEVSSLLKDMILHDLNTEILIDKILKAKREEKLVGICGRASIARSSQQYRDVALIGKKLAENGYTLITGGGPGTMEAAHLGSWFATRSEEELDSALKILSQAPKFTDKDYYLKAQEVKDKYPRLYKAKDISIRSFYYYEEPANLFAGYYLIYFFNSLRQDAILMLSKNGAIFFPGGYGTLLELFLALESNSTNEEFNQSRAIVLFSSKGWNKVLGPQILQKTYMTDSYNQLLSYIDNF